jgi:hypothetical protein
MKVFHMGDLYASLYTHRPVRFFIRETGDGGKMFGKVRTTIRSAVIVIVTGLFFGCGGGGDSDNGLDLSKLTPANFIGGTTPQLDLSSPVPDWTWNDPHVIKVGNEYWMYASATDNFNYPVRLYRLVSTDGISWILNPSAPILDAGIAGSWDAGSVETPAVVYFNGKYHLFWTGYFHYPNDPLFAVTEMRIGHAVSDDGITFTRDPANPIIVPSGTDADASNDWFAFVVAEPAPVVFNNKIYLYFTAAGADTGADLDMGVGASLQVIGLVTSSDGTSWSAPVRVLRPDQSIYPRKPDAGNDYWVGYSTPNAIVLNGEMHLFFDVARQYDVAPAPIAETWLQLRLHHARSADGVAGWTQDASPIRLNTDFTWSTREIRSPDAFLDGTTLRLYFAGDSLYFDNKFGIGMMTCDLSR